MTAAVLIVDDEPHILWALERLLRRQGFEIYSATSGEEALKVLDDHEIAVIICDQRMPGMQGTEVLAESIELRPDAVRITLTGYTDLHAALDTVNEGKISHFLLKPWDDDHLRSVVLEAARHYEMQQEIHRLHELTRCQRDELKEWNHQLESKVRERTAALHTAYEETLDALVLALDTRERATAGHSRRVATYALYLALQLDIEPTKLEDLHRGALLHDIGKIGIPDAILLKPGKLTPDERAVIEGHVVIGRRILEKIGYLEQAVAIPKYHHERYDGTGYCEGLAGASIPVEARVFAVADVYDALRSDRPYKKAMPYRQASELIAREAGSHFDPAIVSAFGRIELGEWLALAEAASRTTRFRDTLAACEKIRGGLRRSHRTEAA